MSEDKVCPACKGDGFIFWKTGNADKSYPIDCLYCMGSGISWKERMSRLEDRTHRRIKAEFDSGKT